MNENPTSRTHTNPRKRETFRAGPLPTLQNYDRQNYFANSAVSFHAPSFIMSEHITAVPFLFSATGIHCKYYSLWMPSKYSASWIDPLGMIHTFSIQNSASSPSIYPFSYPPLQTQSKAICILMHTDDIPSVSSPTESTLRSPVFLLRNASPPYLLQLLVCAWASRSKRKGDIRQSDECNKSFGWRLQDLATGCCGDVYRDRGHQSREIDTS